MTERDVHHEATEALKEYAEPDQDLGWEGSADVAQNAEEIAAFLAERGLLVVPPTEGVTVTEWGHRYPDGSIIPDSSETVAKSRAAISRVRGNSLLVLVRRNVTEWAEVPGDTEAGS